MVVPWFRVSVAALAVGVASSACSGSLTQTAAAGESTASVAQNVAPPSRLAGLPDFASLAEHYGPAVVNVAVVGKSQQVEDSPGLPPGMSPNDPFSEFFRRFGRPGPMPRGEMPPSRGEGSGFIVSQDGYILTNAHVVQNADEVTVKMTDRREYTAKVVGVDESTDVAVLKIEAGNLPTVRIGDPSKLRPGQWVIAIGSPFGFDNSVTAGIVSATSRSMPGGNYSPFIQTDVAVNPGNSGGPLFNLDGEVVGINSQIFSRTGGYMGLSFAIPIDVATNVQQQLVSNGKVTRSRIGVSIQDVNAQLAESFGLDRPRGALVGMVEDGSPGAKAGIKAGDVILKVGKTQIDTSSQVPGLIANTRPGSPVDLEVWRDGKVKRVTAHPEEIKDNSERVAATDTDKSDETARLGLAVRPLAPDEKRQAETSGDLLVEDVDGPAAAAGVRPGDIILGVNGKPVRSLDELKSAAKKRNGKVVALLIERDNAQIFVPVRVG
jgi:serine protease Do